MPKFTIKDLMLSTTLIALGIGSLAWVERYKESAATEGVKVTLTRLICWTAAPLLISAGVLFPFVRSWAGTLIAFSLGTIAIGLLLLAMFT